MYIDSSFFCTISRDCNKVKKLRINREVQKELVSVFSQKSDQLLNNEKEFIEFDGRYKPSENEVFYIKNFNMPETIKKAIKTPTSVEELLPKNNKNKKINSIFTGTLNNENKYIISFQNFMPSQIITASGVGLIFNNNSFNKISKLAVNIKEQVDCIYMNNNLYFSSYWVARQIFDLSDYYKMATDEELKSFIKKDVLTTMNEDMFFQNADEWIRRKVAFIEDSKVLERNSPYDIKKIAEDHNVDLKLNNDNQILVPDEKQDLKDLLKFLDEDIFKGPLTNNTYMTNSKRKL